MLRLTVAAGARWSCLRKASTIGSASISCVCDAWAEPESKESISAAAALRRVGCGPGSAKQAGCATARAHLRCFPPLPLLRLPALPHNFLLSKLHDAHPVAESLRHGPLPPQSHGILERPGLPIEGSRACAVRLSPTLTCATAPRTHRACRSLPEPRAEGLDVRILGRRLLSNGGRGPIDNGQRIGQVVSRRAVSAAVSMGAPPLGALGLPAPRPSPTNTRPRASASPPCAPAPASLPRTRTRCSSADTPQPWGVSPTGPQST